jgi:DNA (cytosine-5)-methyltransferase 1
VAHGVAARVDRLRAIGNGQVPQTAALAFLILMGQLELEAA